jgi:hypothetical protein|uniref:Uncharacterized protein n=1 Tax=Desulfobacca acetoxidans TaxID=60893 RepID=A0A7V6A291_9BACT
MKKGLMLAAATLGMVFCWLMVMGCGESGQPFAGTYRSVEPYAGKGHIELELKENGEATWKLAQEGQAIRFKWRAEGGQLWFYTKEGGIILATPSDGGKKLNVDMTGQWHPSCPRSNCITFERVKAGSF